MSTDPKKWQRRSHKTLAEEWYCSVGKEHYASKKVLSNPHETRKLQIVYICEFLQAS